MKRIALLFVTLSLFAVFPAISSERNKNEKTTDTEASVSTDTLKESGKKNEKTVDAETVTEAKVSKTSTKKATESKDKEESSLDILALIALILSVLSIVASFILYLKNKQNIDYQNDRITRHKEEFKEADSDLKVCIDNFSVKLKKLEASCVEVDHKLAANEERIKAASASAPVPAPAPAPEIDEAVPTFHSRTYYASYSMDINGVEVEKLKDNRGDSSLLKIVTTSDTDADFIVIDGLNKTQLARLFDSECTEVEGNTQSYNTTEIIENGKMRLDTDEWRVVSPVKIKLN